jgi:hypothetical protein
MGSMSSPIATLPFCGKIVGCSLWSPLVGLCGVGMDRILYFRNISRHADACLFCSCRFGSLWSGLILLVSLLLVVELSLSLSLSVSCFRSVGGIFICLSGCLVGSRYTAEFVRCLTLRSWFISSSLESESLGIVQNRQTGELNRPRTYASVLKSHPSHGKGGHVGKAVGFAEASRMRV